MTTVNENAELVEWLETALEEAREGIIETLLIVLRDDDENIYTGWVGSLRRPYELIGATDVLKREFMDGHIEGLVDEPEEWDGHDSDCALHNEPAYRNGPCNCR